MNKQNNSFIDYTIGSIDGILWSFVSFSIVYFFIGINQNFAIILSIIATVVLSIIFGITRFLGEQQEIDHQHPHYSLKDQEKENQLLAHIGIDEKIRLEMKGKISQEKELWLSEIKENQLEWEIKSKKRAWNSGLRTTIGFFISGIVFLGPLFSFSIELSFLNPFIYWFFSCLFFAGGIKSKYIGKSFFMGGVKAMIYGLMMMVSLFLVNEVLY